MDAGRYQVTFYETRSGRSPVEEFLDKLPLRQCAKVLYVLDLLEEAGFSLGPPWLKKVDRELWEVRIPVEGVQVRVLFCEERREFVLLHALKKKQPRLPPKDLRTARGRWREYVERRS